MAYLVIDLEMTGPDPEFHDFIQIGAILANERWELIDEYETLVYPDNEDAYSVYAEQVHGLSIHDLYDAPASYEAIEDLENWVMQKLKMRSKRHLKSVVIAGQSVYNDISFLRAKYLKHKLKWHFAYRLLDLTNFSYVIFKILDFNGYEVPKLYGLDTVAEFFGIERESEEHDALEDARITFQCFGKFYEIMQQFSISEQDLNGVLTS